MDVIGEESDGESDSEVDESEEQSDSEADESDP